MLLLTSRYQAASAWLLILTLHLIITPQIMFRRLLKGEKWRWYRDDIGRPLIAALGISVVSKLLLSDQLPVQWLVAGIALVLGGGMAIRCISSAADS